MNEYNLCYSLDNNYAEQFCVSAVSVLKNSLPDDNINFYILDGGLSDENKQKIELLKNIKSFNIEYFKINNADFAVCPMLKDKDSHYSDYHVTLPTYYRFKLPELLPQKSKVLYLDCDVIIRSDLNKLYNTDLTDKAAGMILDVESKKEAARLHLEHYFNAGVMLINLDFWRKHNVPQKFFDFAQTNKSIILWQDQDIINSVLNDDIKSVDKFWNYQYFLYDEVNPQDLSDAKILHLSGRFKPWLMPFEHPVYECYYYYLSFTPFVYKITEYRNNSFGKRLKNNIGGSATNILINATDEDLKLVYEEVNKVYNYTAENVAVVTKRFDEEIPKIYSYINKAIETRINETADSIYNNVNLAIEDKIQVTGKESYKNINKAIETRINEMVDVLYDNVNKMMTSRIQETTDSIYDNINKAIEAKTREVFPLVYDYINEAIEKKNNEINLIYEEITKNYKYTEKLVEQLKNELTAK